MGYYKQEHAKYALIKSFTENKDYVLLPNVRENPNVNTGVSNGNGRPAENIYLILRCFNAALSNHIQEDQRTPH